MRSWVEKRSVWIYKPSIDFRKQINGLVAMVTEEMGQRPNDGSLYIFRNRGRNKIKVLMWDRNGFVLAYKRLEKGRFDMPEDKAGSVEITGDQLLMLISGMPMIHLCKNSEKEVAFS